MLEVGLVAAVVKLGPTAGVVAAPHPQRVRIALEQPPPPKPKPPPPKPKPPPPKPKPPPPKPPPPKPLPPPPKPLPPPPLPPPPPPPVPRPPPRPLPRPRPVLHRLVPQPRPVPPAPQPQPPAPPAPSPAAVASMVMRYAAMLNAKVQVHLVVPEMVQMMHLSGTTTVAITVAPDGQVQGVSVRRSSGFSGIDRAAVAAVRSTAMPPFPAGMPHHAVTFVLRVRLNGS